MSDLLLYDVGEAGRTWTHDSLNSGRALSQTVLATLDLKRGSTFILGVADPSRLPVTERPDQLRNGLNDSSLASIELAGESLFRLLTSVSAKRRTLTVTVEDDLARIGDPALHRRRMGETVEFDQTILHAMNLNDIGSASALARLLGRSSGYPLNGFVHLQIRRREWIVQELVNSLLAIINSVFDGEAYAIWLPHSVQADLDL